MIVERTDRANPHDLGHAHRQLPTLRVDLAILAAIFAIPWAVLTVHTYKTMLGTTIFLLIAQTATQPAAPALSYKDGVFRISDAGISETISTRGPASSAALTAFQEKVGDKYVVFDKRGLTVRFGSSARTWKLDDIPTSPRFFSRDEIIETLSRIESGEYIKSASALAGWEKTDKEVFLMPRWLTRGNLPILEAVVRVDLSQSAPNYSALGVMPLPSLGKGMVQDSLFTTNGGVASVAADGDRWGICFLPQGSLKAAYRPVGLGTPDIKHDEKGRTIQFVEKTPYGTYLAGISSCPDGARTNLAESREPIEFIGENPDAVLIRGATQTILRNTNSGLELPLPKDIGAVRTKSGVLVWTPKASPKVAMLYAIHSLRSVAKWSAPTPSSNTGGSPGGSRKPPTRP